MSFWTFSDVFEEQGVTRNVFRGGQGLRAEDGIDKPSYYAFALLHQLGNRRLANASKDVIVTKTKDGNLAIAAWKSGRSGPAGKYAHDGAGISGRARERKGIHPARG